MKRILLCAGGIARRSMIRADGRKAFDTGDRLRGKARHMCLSAQEGEKRWREKSI